MSSGFLSMVCYNEEIPWARQSVLIVSELFLKLFLGNSFEGIIHFAVPLRAQKLG